MVKYYRDKKSLYRLICLGKKIRSVDILTSKSWEQITGKLFHKLLLIFKESFTDLVDLR